MNNGKNLDHDAPIICPLCGETVTAEIEYVEYCGESHAKYDWCDFMPGNGGLNHTVEGFCGCFYEVDCEHCGTRLNNNGGDWFAVP